jgi:hypothetical protein
VDVTAETLSNDINSVKAGLICFVSVISCRIDHPDVARVDQIDWLCSIRGRGSCAAQGWNVGSCHERLGLCYETHSDSHVIVLCWIRCSLQSTWVNSMSCYRPCDWKWRITGASRYLTQRFASLWEKFRSVKISCSDCDPLRDNSRD